jgi:hypothetical protein
LIYRRQPKGFLLYSTVADRIDDGGKRAAPEMPSASEDLLLKPTSTLGSPAS